MSQLVTERFHLNPSAYKNLTEKFPSHSFGFNGFGEVTYYRTYSRSVEPAYISSSLDKTTQEHWPDTCLRVINGTFSIRKDWYKRLGLKWEEQKWQAIARQMLEYMYQMKFLPPGRGLWAMGSDHVYNVGSMALNNCATTRVSSFSLSSDLAWSMDALMCGCGVGYRLELDEEYLRKKVQSRLNPMNPKIITILDSREGWVDSLKACIDSFFEGIKVQFDYSEIRCYGEPIKGFGGTSSGPAPLIILHRRIEHYFDLFIQGRTNATRLACDLINAVGTCVVSGNVRRGAQIIIGSPHDKTFMDIKDFNIHNDFEKADKIKELHDEIFELSKIPLPPGTPNRYNMAIDFLNQNDLPTSSYMADRINICGLSNNSAALEDPEDFEKLSLIAYKTTANADMGMLNILNIQKYGRFGEKYTSTDYLRHDAANSCNPCGEIALENKELCNLVELFPTRCSSIAEFQTAARLATIYAQTVSLLLTHSPETNSVLSRNRRIGVSISGVADWLDIEGAGNLTKILRQTYNIVRQTARGLARESGVPEPIRVTTVKPSGTVSQLAGVSSGMHFPTFQYAIRRIRVAKDSEMEALLFAHKVPGEPDEKVNNTTVFSFPIDQGKTRPATSVSAWEQFALLAMLQREWADNMVSCTIYFNPETEAHQVEHMLGQFAPLIKSVSMLPHTPEGAFAQMPYQGISVEQYMDKRRKIQRLDFSSYNSLNQPENKDATLYCENDSCET